MRNLTANFGKNLDICKKFSKNLVNERGNLPEEVSFPIFRTWKLSHLVSQQRNSVSIVSRCCSPC